MTRKFKRITECYTDLKYVFDPLPAGEYIVQKTSKQGGNFVLHCTQSSSVKYLRQVWQNDRQGAIATMFAADKDGTLYQFFEEDYWAYASAMGAGYDKQAIQCEMANKAFLKYTGGRYYWMAGGKWVIYDDGMPFKSAQPWQGYQFWDPYPPEQVETVAKLTAYILYNHGIPLEFHADYRYERAVAQKKGVVQHSNLSLQRCDPGPAFPFAEYEKKARAYFLELCNKHGFPVYE